MLNGSSLLDWNSGCGRKRKESEGSDSEECVSVCFSEALRLCLNGCLCVCVCGWVGGWVVGAAVVPRA